MSVGRVPSQNGQGPTLTPALKKKEKDCTEEESDVLNFRHKRKTLE